MVSSESPVHGAQEGSAYNGHFESVCYHPLFLFTEHGDCLAATLQPGNVHSAEDWDYLLVSEIERHVDQRRQAGDPLTRLSCQHRLVKTGGHLAVRGGIRCTKALIRATKTGIPVEVVDRYPAVSLRQR